MDGGEAVSAALFSVSTSHCIYCDHKESDISAIGCNDAMERHYWDKHYNQATRDKLRAAGQQPTRIGRKP